MGETVAESQHSSNIRDEERGVVGVISQPGRHLFTGFTLKPRESSFYSSSHHFHKSCRFFMCSLFHDVIMCSLNQLLDGDVCKQRRIIINYSPSDSEGDRDKHVFLSFHSLKKAKNCS